MDEEVELRSIGSELPEPIAMRDRFKPPAVTWYRTIVTVSILGFGTWKTVASVQNATIISNVLDWILGVALAVLYFWLGEFAEATALCWLFRRSVFVDVRIVCRLSFDTVTSLRQTVDGKWQLLITMIFVHGRPHQPNVPRPSEQSSSFDPHNLSLPFSLADYSLSSLPMQSIVSDLLSTQLQMRPFQWDLLSDPVHLAAPSASPSTDGLLQPAQLATPATTPPVAELKITHPDLPWLINVSMSGHFSNTCVTVGDVLQQLYQTLRLNVSRTEYEIAEKTGPGATTAISSAFELRTRLAGEYVVLERKRGVRRIDFLKGKTQFAGFTATVRQDDGVTLLHLDVQ
ncbi:hypothetical protein PsYK624_013970 [Phanerochaete sordida]|uniref:DUF6699 domain-containing protein n=1 Tax=Phanerochaete sordida TaxID=48140 RepID=A0A9P3L8T0_9APHY|nr:hypothetical protein PsYK624_013970 [Phanerochaete sordida]